MKIFFSQNEIFTLIALMYVTIDFLRVKGQMYIRD